MDEVVVLIVVSCTVVSIAGYLAYFVITHECAVTIVVAIKHSLTEVVIKQYPCAISIEALNGIASGCVICCTVVVRAFECAAIINTEKAALCLLGCESPGAVAINAVE